MALEQHGEQGVKTGSINYATQLQRAWHRCRWHDTATDGMTQVQMTWQPQMAWHVQMTWHRYKWHDTGRYGMTQVHMTWQSQKAWHRYRWHDTITDGMTKFSKWRGPSTCTNHFLHSLILPFIFSHSSRQKGVGPASDLTTDGQQ